VPPFEHFIDTVSNDTGNTCDFAYLNSGIVHTNSFDTFHPVHFNDDNVGNTSGAVFTKHLSLESKLRIDLEYSKLRMKML
jgi:hypothetical protein